MKRISTIISAVTLFCLLAAAPLATRAQNQVDLSITAQDHYTRVALDSVSLALYFDGVLLDSTVTGPDGTALMRITVTSLQAPGEMPSEFTLSANYPNPFQTDTRVDLSVPESQPVRIEIYNVIGQRVATQAVQLNAGRYALNLSMGHLPVGVYFLRVSGRDAKVEKMIKMGTGFGSPGAMFRMEPLGGQVETRPVTDRKADSAYILSDEEGYVLRAVRNRYQDGLLQPEIRGDAELLVELRRNNIVALETINEQEQPVSRTVRITGEQFATLVTTPDTLVLGSGVFTVAAADEPEPGSPADFAISDVFEIISRDSAYTIRAFIPQEATVSGRVANDLEEFMAGANVQIYRQGMLYTSTTTGAGGEFSVELLADGSLYSIVIYPEHNLNGAFVPEAFYSFSPDAQVITPRPGGSYSLEFLLYTESPLTIPGGDGSRPAGPYTLVNSGATVSIANIPPDLGIVGGSARAYSPTVAPDAFPGEFATRQQGFESGLISGGFASVNLLRSDGNGGVEPISELRDSTGAPVQVTLRFLMDPLDYDVLRDPASLSHLPGYVNRPDTIDVPLYYYHEPSGDWLLSPQFGWLENERGAIPASELERIRSGEYPEPVYVTGLVDHFTWYNLDYPENRACLTGRIVDQNNNAVKDGKLSFRSLPQLVGRSFYSNTSTIHTDQQGYFRYVGPRTERNSGDDWNDNNRIDTFYAQGELNDKNTCRVGIFDNNGSGYPLPQFPDSDGCGNIGTIRVSLKEAKKEKFSVTFRDIERDGQPGQLLFVDPRSVSGLNYAYATLTDLKVPLMSDIWNCACDNGTPFPDCNRLSTIDGSGKASFEIPVLARDSNDPVQKEEKLVGQFSYRKMRPDLGEGAYEFAQCAYLTKTKPPASGDPPIVVECEVKVTGKPVIEIVRIEGEIISDDPIPPLNFLYDELVTLEATGTNVNGESIDHLDMFFWTNDLETLFIASRRVVTRPAHQLFGTGTGLSIRAHGINLYGFKGDTLATSISVAEVNIAVTASQGSIATGGTTTVIAAVTGAANTGVRWQSLTPGIASVNNQGEVLGLQPGTARIRAQSLADLSKTDELELTVIQLIADFSVSPAAGDSLTEFTFDASSSIGNITAFEWDFGDGNSANGQVVNHVFGASGVFDVTLSVTGDFGLQASQSIQVSTTGRPLVVLTANPQSGLAPLEVSFEGSASVSPTGVISQYNWDFGDGNSAEEADVTHTYVQNGSYYAKLTITDNAENSSADSVLIRVVAAPVASFTVFPESGQPPLEVTVDASGSSAGDGSINLYTWDFGDGTVLEQGDSIETHIYNDVGVYTILLTIENEFGLTDTSERDVNVGCETFEGDINISTSDQFALLQNVCRVNGNVSISGLTGITTLPEFNNLVSITGSLSITSINSLASIIGFDNLRHVGGLTISNHPELTTINGFENLITGSVSITSNSDLQVIFGFDRLETVADLVIMNNGLLTVTPQFNNLRSITNLGRIRSNGNTSLSGFEKLESVGGTLEIFTNTNLQNITGFGSLQSVGALVIEQNSQLATINAFQNLRRVNGSFTVRFNSALATLNGFDRVERVNQNLTFNNSQISACKLLDIGKKIWHREGIGGTVQVVNNANTLTGNATLSNQAQMDALAGTCMITGTLTVNTQLEEVTGVDSLRFVGELRLSSSANITDARNFGKLFEVVNLRVNSNQKLTSLAGLDSLIRVNEVQIASNPLFDNLSALNGLSELTELNLQSMPNLTSLNGLQSMRKLDRLQLTNLAGLKRIDELSGLTEIRTRMTINGSAIEIFPDLFLNPAFKPAIIIQDNPNIQNLAGLESLTEIGDLSVRGNASLTSLQGMNNVRVINGFLSLFDSPGLTSLEGLSSLERIQAASTFALAGFAMNNIGIANLGGLENLVATPEAGIQNLSQLQNIDALSNLSSVSRISITQVPLLTNVNGLSGITGTIEQINLNSLAQITDISGLSGIGTVTGNLSLISLQTLTDVGGLENLESVGSLAIRNNASLSNISSLSNLKTANNVNIGLNPSLQNLVGLSNLERVNSTLTLESNNLLTNIDPLAGLTTLANLSMSNNTGLLNIDAFENLTSMNSVSIVNNPALLNIDGLSNLVSARSITLNNNVLLENIDGLSSLSNNVENINIQQSPALSNLNGLSSLSRISFSLSLNGTGLTSLDGLENLTTANSFDIRNNSVLTSLDGLSGVTTLGTLTVFNNENLIRVSGMTSLERLQSLFVNNNVKLPLCDIQILIDQVVSRGGNITSINTTGNDPEGVCEP